MVEHGKYPAFEYIQFIWLNHIHTQMNNVCSAVVAHIALRWRSVDMRELLKCSRRKIAARNRATFLIVS